MICRSKRKDVNNKSKSTGVGTVHLLLWTQTQPVLDPSRAKPLDLHDTYRNSIHLCSNEKGIQAQSYLISTNHINFAPGAATMSTSAPAQDTSTPPWWAAFPEPKAPVHALEPEDVAQLLESHSAAGPNSVKSFLLVDVRRTDWEGGTVTSSINLPAHTLYQTRPVIYQLCKQAGVKTIIFYCGKEASFFVCGSKYTLDEN